MTKHVPFYDPNFKPAYIELLEFYKKSTNSIKIALERNNKLTYVRDIKITDDINESYFYVERIVKTLLWLVGGFKIYVHGNKEIYEKLKQDYSPYGKRSFDYHFMGKVYDNTFEVVYVDDIKLFPTEKNETIKIGGHKNGNRIGFDAGGSDRKVSAISNGEVVYSEEVLWLPKLNDDYNYHYQEILTAFKTAASKLNYKVDGIGVSSAGIYIDNKIKVASLFVKINEQDFKDHVENMYIDIAKEIGDIPLVVANDGDVAALAGSEELNDTGILGIAMGTSEAAGYINIHGGINGWLNELAFVPVDFNQDAMIDEWSGDYGCGVKYFSQDGAIKLAEAAGLNLEGTLAQKLVQIQDFCKENDERALQIFKDIGICFGYGIAYYTMFYDIKYILIMGRVTSGVGGDLIIENAKMVLNDLCLGHIKLVTPDEKSKRLGQAVVAATLPEIK